MKIEKNSSKSKLKLFGTEIELLCYKCNYSAKSATPIKAVKKWKQINQQNFRILRMYTIVDCVRTKVEKKRRARNFVKQSIFKSGGNAISNKRSC